MMYLGNEIAKASFDAPLRQADGSKAYRRFDNDAKGDGALAAWLGEQGVSELHANKTPFDPKWGATPKPASQYLLE